MKHQALFHQKDKSKKNQVSSGAIFVQNQNCLLVIRPRTIIYHTVKKIRRFYGKIPGN